MGTGQPAKELKLKCPRIAWVAAERSRSGCKATGTGTLAQVPSSVNASQRRTTPTMDRRHYTATLGTRECVNQLSHLDRSPDGLRSLPPRPLRHHFSSEFPVFSGSFSPKLLRVITL